MRTLRVRTALLGFALLVVLAAGVVGTQTYPEGLVLWNKLGSQAEIENSVVGLDGTFLGGGFTAGMFGSAFVADYSQDTLVWFPKEVVPVYAGCIEFWARLIDPPGPIGAVNCRPCFVRIADNYAGYVITLASNNGKGSGGLTGGGGHGYTTGTGPWGSWTYEQVLGSGQVEEWHHYALVWDENGITGVADGTKRVAVFLDGQLNSGNWWTDPNPEFAPLTSGRLQLLHNYNEQGSVAIDNIKIWDYAKTDFADRFVEGFAVNACVDIDPDVLNPRSAGRWIAAYIELPEDYDPEQIDVATVLLNDTVPAELRPTSIGDYDDDGIPDRTVKFSRPAVIDILPYGEHVEVCVSGEVGEHSFEGCDTIRVLMPKVKYPNGGEVLEVGEQCLITWEHPAGYEADWSSVYYTADDGETWNLIDDRIEDTSCPWMVPDVASDCCKVLVEAYDAQGVMGYDMSDQSFIVSNAAGIPMDEVIPTSFALYPANPNPFTQGTVVSFDLPDSRHVKITIHDVRGRLVQELIDEARPAKSYSVQWDGKGSFGVDVPTGIYFVHLEAGDYKATAKIVLVR